jgi:hypothetical protein
MENFSSRINGGELSLCCCDLLNIFTHSSTILNGAVNLSYLSSVRAYILLSKTATITDNESKLINYCPFCGAELPGGLEEELTKILQNEYRLESWKDYKKAPHEFHTDEWWKKRGL